MSAAGSTQSIWEIISTVSTAAAAGFAAWSAWISRSSSEAAKAAVEEAREARRAELAPRLVLERDFLDFHFQWPHPDTLNGEAVFLARKHWKDTKPSVPTFSLTNHGGGPALEVQLVFDLEDHNGELSVPDTFKPLGLQVTEMPVMPSQHKVAILQYPRVPGSQGGGAGLPLYRRNTVDLPNVAPGQTRKVDFPANLLNRLFLRGLQYWARRGQENSLKEIVVTVRITAHTMDGDAYETQFRYEAFPFWQGIQSPLIVNGHFRELPMYPKSDDLRVA